SGGDVGAQNAKLTIMVGGDQKAFDKILPIFQYMGENIVLQGPAGAGQHTKAVNQIAIAPGMIGVCEALIYAKESGLDPTTVLSKKLKLHKRQSFQEQLRFDLLLSYVG